MIDAAELERLHSKNDIETEVKDGTYFYCMRTDTNGHPDIFGDVSRGCSNEYSYDENYVVIHGSPNYILDDNWTFTEDNTLEVKYWGFRYNENTIFEAVGGNLSKSFGYHHSFRFYRLHKFMQRYRAYVDHYG